MGTSLNYSIAGLDHKAKVNSMFGFFDIPAVSLSGVEYQFELPELALSGYTHIITACPKAVICYEQPTTHSGYKTFRSGLY
jgi:hypothetical protein